MGHQTNYINLPPRLMKRMRERRIKQTTGRTVIITGRELGVRDPLLQNLRLGFYDPAVASFVGPSYQCDLACPICLSESSPSLIGNKRPQTVDIDEMKRWLACVEAAGFAQYNLSSGGTLQPHLLDLTLELVNYGTKKGLLCSGITTSGSVGKIGIDNVREFLKKLKDACYPGGFKLSVDGFHHVPAEWIANLIQAQLEIFTERTGIMALRDVDISQIVISSVFGNLTTPYAQLNELYDVLLRRGVVVGRDPTGYITSRGDTIKINFHELARVGRAKNLPPAEFVYSPLPNVGCGANIFELRDHLNTKIPLNTEILYIEPDGAVKPCCGPGVYDNDGLIFGNIEEGDLTHLIRKANSIPIINVLMAMGPFGLATLIEREKKGFLDRVWTHRCEACNYILENYRDFLENVMEPLVQSRYWNRFYPSTRG